MLLSGVLSPLLVECRNLEAEIVWVLGVWSLSFGEFVRDGYEVTPGEIGAV
jgi:hypothetical protein